MSEQSFKLGFIMGLLCPSEKRVEEPVAYLYGHVAKEGEAVTHVVNGVSYVGAVLPKVPERDREKYPYVSIIKKSGYSWGGDYDLAYLCFSDTPLLVEDDDTMSLHSKATFVSYVIDYIDGETDWQYRDEEEDKEVAIFSLPSVLLPAPFTYINYDAYYDEYAGDGVAGTLALAKSDFVCIPIYEEEEPVTPAPYKKELLYLESTGTQWLDVGKTINTATDTVELVFQNTESALYKWFFGEHDNGARFGLGSGDGSNKRNVAYGSSTYKVSDKQQYDSKHTFIANENGVYLDGTKIANFASFASTSTLYLFNLNLSGGNYVCCAKIWSYRHTRNGALLCDFIPVLDWDDVPCMYDRVSGELFYNKGTGEFLYGTVDE